MIAVIATLSTCIIITVLLTSNIACGHVWSARLAHVVCAFLACSLGLSLKILPIILSRNSQKILPLFFIPVSKPIIPIIMLIIVSVVK